MDNFEHQISARIIYTKCSQPSAGGPRPIHSTVQNSLSYANAFAPSIFVARLLQTPRTLIPPNVCPCHDFHTAYMLHQRRCKVCNFQKKKYKKQFNPISHEYQGNLRFIAFVLVYLILIESIEFIQIRM